MTLPFERIATTGDRALATWEQLKNAGRGVPVVIGNDESVGILAIEFNPNPLWPKRLSLVDTLAAAERIRHPEDLVAERTAKRRITAARASVNWRVDRDGKRRELTPEETAMLQDMQEPRRPPVGEWSAEPSPSVGLSVAKKYGQTFLPNVYIALIPTDDWTTVPAHLRWGGRDDCPRAEYHVAALRSWRDRFGAELIGLSLDRMDLRVASRPNTREQALELAREHYVYCSDIVDQGDGTLSTLAASLFADDWWNFWWD
jgi:hypothetical protein